MAGRREAARKAGSKNISVLFRLAPLVRPYLGRVVLATVVLLIGSGINLIYPQVAKEAIDAGFSQTDTRTIDLMALGIVGVFAVSALLTWLRHYLMSWLGQRVVADLRDQVFAKLVRQPVGYFHEHPSGELTGRLAADVTTIQNIVGSELSMAMRELVTLIGGLVMLFLASVKLTLLMLLVVPPVVVVGLVFGRRISKLSTSMHDSLAKASAHVQENVGAIATVQAYRRETVETTRYLARVDESFDAAKKLATWRGGFIATMSFAGWLATAVMLWLGGRQIIAGTLSAGDLTAFLLYTTMVAFALGGLANLWGSLQAAAGATKRLFEILDDEPAIKDPEAPAPWVVDDETRGSFAFRQVRFRYPSRPDVTVLDGVDFEVQRGETVAIVGKSGAGKSTIASLLYRFFDVEQAEGRIRDGDGDGAVIVEGRDVRTVKLHDLRGRLAIVSQEPTLFSGSIHDNIAYARPDASREEVEKAAKLAHAHEFTSAFPEGYDTVIGERGVKLSGGQRQRVAIARALLADPAILVLDEATSALDGESEHLVHEALARLMEGRTTLVIAHRLSTVKDADRIIVLDKGRIADVGDHDALLKGSTIYRTLVEHQLLAAA